MKFQQLPIGARFEYQGKIYVKNGPITASSEQGGQAMIPRYAVLKPLGDQPAADKTAPRRRLDEAAVMAAFDEFYRCCQRLSNVDARAALDAARQRFIAHLHAAARGKSD
ncbi:MAG: hypothetical protein KF778_14675 [Rhodocyclaceae bacterium]|nr:hypothetical protein [Rhodocyclaceae bacterium]MBX3669642.1 hypothetical protein [Rhodocyclaceae bacterium]